MLISYSQATHGQNLNSRFGFFTITPRENSSNFREHPSFTAIGDDVKDAKSEVLKLARTRDIPKGNGFNMEPFEVLRDFCRDKNRHQIGGAPQVLKIYKHMNAMPYAVYWPTRESKGRSLMGRPLLEYEMANYLMLDPDTLKTEDYIPTLKPEKMPADI